ncbi:ubiquinone biosynthesis accessory factor UbiJ [Pararobbsia alpina]|nr:sterol-binding protein [Pararobbsia alpina]
MTVAANPLIAVVNHLLARESWARAKLLPYAGRRARVRMPVGALDVVVLADGLLGPVLPAVSADASGDASDSAHAAPEVFDVTITVEASAAPAFLSGGQAGAMKYVRIDGDAEFATALGYLAEHLRWEPEEDLAKLVGDAGAHRAATFAREIVDRTRRTGRNLLESVAEFLLDEDPQLVRRGELETLVADLTRMRDDVARFEKRIERLEREAPRARRATVPATASIPASAPASADAPAETAPAKPNPPDGTH